MFAAWIRCGLLFAFLVVCLLWVVFGCWFCCVSLDLCLLARRWFVLILLVTLFFACAFLLGSLPNSVVVFTLCVGYLVVYCGLVVVYGYLWWWVLVVCLWLVTWLLSVRFWAWFAFDCVHLFG